MDISNLENASESLKKTFDLCKKRESDIPSDVLKDASVFRFKQTYGLSLNIIRQYLKKYHHDPVEAEKATFAQLIKIAEEHSLVGSTLETWELFQKSRAKYNESYDEKITEKILSVVPSFLNEVQHLIVQLKTLRNKL